MPYPDNFQGTNMDDRSDDIDKRNEDEVIESRREAKEYFDEMAIHAHPDSIMGIMERMKKELDAFNTARPTITNPATNGGFHE